MTALYRWVLAAEFGHVAAIEALLKQMTVINMQDRASDSPVHYAVRGGFAEAISTLVQKSADIIAKSVGGRTVLHIKTEEQNIDLIQFRDSNKRLFPKGYKVQRKFQPPPILRFTT